jgi:hypothetical protein
LLHQEKRSADVRVVERVEIFDPDVFDLSSLGDAGVRDQDASAALLP